MLRNRFQYIEFMMNYLGIDHSSAEFICPSTVRYPEFAKLIWEIFNEDPKIIDLIK